jgi:hypothetical protein
MEHITHCVAVDAPSDPPKPTGVHTLARALIRWARLQRGK